MTSSDTCIAGTGNVATAPLCGSSTYGSLGVCGKCQKNTDGSGGDGDGSTKGTCQTSGHKCYSTGSCCTACTSGQICSATGTCGKENQNIFNINFHLI